MNANDIRQYMAGVLYDHRFGWMMRPGKTNER